MNAEDGNPSSHRLPEGCHVRLTSLVVRPPVCCDHLEVQDVDFSKWMLRCCARFIAR